MVMDKQTRSLVWIGAIVLVVLVLFIILSTTGNSVSNKETAKTGSNIGDKEVVKIGVTLPLTGDLAFLGIPDKNAVEMAKEDFADKYDYQLIFEDDSYDSKKVTSNLQKFINVNGVDVIASIGSMPANIIAPIAQENSVIYTAFSASDTEITVGRSHAFDFTTTPRKEVERMIQELRNRGYSDVSIARTNMDFTSAIMEEFEKQASAGGINIVSEEVYNLGETDFKTGILKLQKSDAQIIVVIMQTPELEIFAKQYQESDSQIPLTSIESFGLTEEKNLFEGLWYIDAGYPDESFFSEYEARFGEEPSQYAADAYSTMKILITAYESFDEKPSSDEVAAKLSTIRNFDTPLGSVSANENGVFETPATVKQIKNGESVLV